MSPRLPTRVLAVQSDRRLVELAVAGHERAFEALAHRYRAPLQRYCVRLGLPEAQAEEVVQHTLLQAWLALDRGAAIKELRPWLYRVSHNATLNAVRRLGAVGPLPLDAITDTRAAVGDDAERRMAMRDTLAHVSALPPLQRDAIVLSAIEGRSHEEVARTLGVSDGAVRGLLYRARVTLRGAAAALTPGPLIGWALGTSHRVAPTAARLAELSTPGTDAGGAALLAPGLAIGATAVLALGAVLGPLHGGHTSAHRVAAAHSSRTATAPAVGEPGKAPLVRAGDVWTPRVRAVHRGAPGPTPSSGGSAPRAMGTEGAGGGTSTGAALRPGQPEVARSGSGLGSAAVSNLPSSGNPKGVPQGDSSAPQAPPPPSETQQGAPVREQPGEKAQEAAEAAKEQREGEAEGARERGEKEEEAAREAREEETEAASERREREAEAARELREREAEAARERAGG